MNAVALQRRLGFSLLAVAVVAAYANSFGGVFVLDDIPSILNNPTIRQFWPAGPLLHPPAASATVAGRPLLNVSLAISYALSGTRPWGYHLVNLLIHVGAAATLFAVVRRTSQRLLPSLAVALLWALHPVQTEAVTYVIQRAESLASLFYLLAVYGFVRVAEGPNRLAGWNGWSGSSVGFALLAVGTKEIAATIPVVILLYDRCFFAGSFRAALRQRGPYYAALAATWIPLALLVLSTGGNRGGSAGFGAGVSWWAYLATQFPAVVHYLRLIVCPFPLAFEYGTFWVHSLGAIAGDIVVVAALLAATGWALVKYPRCGFLGASFCLLLAPTSLTPGTTQMIVEHRMYLALAPACAAVVFGWVAISEPEAQRCRRFVPVSGRDTKRLQRCAPPVAVALVAAAFGLLTIARNRDYASAFTLWSDTVRRRPQSAFARYSLGTIYLNQGRLPEAIDQLETGRRLRPDYPELLVNLGAALRQAGRLPEALEADERAVVLAPGQPQAENNLAIALAESGQPAAAVGHFQAELRGGSSDPELHANLGFALEAAGRRREAAAEYEKTLAAQPDDQEIRGRLGRLRALIRAGLD